jgi:hypothetical protein
MSRHASLWNKRDVNEPAILKALEAMGAPWFEAGPLDGWTVIDGKFMPCEIKTATGKLTKGQQEFIALCMDRGWPVCVWRTPEEAIECVQAAREVA